MKGMTRVGLFIKAYYLIFRVKKMVKRQGLYSTAGKILKPWNEVPPRLPEDFQTRSKIKYIEDTIHNVCQWQLTPTLCVPRAIAAYVLLRDTGLDPVFNVGMKSEPLIAHAWVQVNGRSVADSYPEEEKHNFKLLFQYPPSPCS